MMHVKKLFLLICCITPLCIAGCKPVVTITSPSSGDTFTLGQKITFKGEATDFLHPNLSDDAFIWVSSKNGEFGKGASIATADLSEGEHTITLFVRDPSNQLGQNSVKITITKGSTTYTTTTIPSAKKAKSDFNGDGTSDLVWHNAVTGESTVWLMNNGECASYKSLPKASDTNWIIARFK